MDVPEEDFGDFDATVSAVWNAAVNASIDDAGGGGGKGGGGIGAGNWTSMTPVGSYDRRDHFLFVVYGVAGTVVNSFGFVGNILTLIVLFSMHPRTSVTLYIIGIALTDAVILGIGEIAIFLPRGLENYYLLDDNSTRPWMKTYVEAMMYTHFSWLYACSEIVIFTNTWYTVCLSVERYLAICKPFQSIYHSRLCSESKTKRILVLVFIICFLVNIPKFLEFETCDRWTYNQTHYCDPKAPVKRPILVPNFRNNPAFTTGYRVIFDNIVRFVVPVLILSILTWKTIRHLQSSGLRHQGNHEASLQVKVTMMCIAVVFVYLICQVPYIAAIGIHTFYPQSSPKRILIFNRSVSITVLLIAVNSSLNFLIYCFLSPHFLRVFRAMFCRRCCPGDELSERDAILNELNHTTASSLSRMPSEVGDRDRASTRARGRNSLRSLRSSTSTGGTIQMKDLQEKLEEALRSSECDKDADARDQVNANLATFVLPEEDEDADSGHSSSGHGSLETSAAAAIASAIAGRNGRGAEAAPAPPIDSPRSQDRLRFGSTV